MPRTTPLFWRVFAVNGGVLATVAVLLMVTPVQISAPIKLEQALIIVAGLAITLAANAPQTGRRSPSASASRPSGATVCLRSSAFAASVIAEAGDDDQRLLEFDRGADLHRGDDQQQRLPPVRHR